METCDVAIIGGGPAGAACAGRLVQSGLDVVVQDKQKFPRDKVCAGWVTPAVLDELDIDRQHYARTRVLQPITGFLTGVVGGPLVRTDYDSPVSFGIRRCEFDDYLLRRSGARLRLGEPLRELLRHAGGWTINGNLSTRMLVGAGGHFCPVARFLGAKVGGRELPVAAQEIEFEMTAAQRAGCPAAPGVPELYFTPDLKGYGWVFRKGDYLNIGLGRQDNRKLAGHVADFVARLQAAGRVPRDIPDKFHGHAYLLYNDAARPILDEAVLLIGDAAGLAYQQSGEGIRPAVESGLLAAHAIAAAAGQYSVANLSAYEQALTQRFGTRRPGKDGVASLLPDSIKQTIASRLLRIGWFARHILINRWFLHAQQPPLELT